MLIQVLKSILASMVMYLSIFINASNATFIDYGTYLTDKNTGLDWMDITPTIGMSLDEVATEIRRGGRFEGWRVVSAYPRASANGVWQMLQNWGAGLPSGTFKGYVEPSMLDQLIQILGSTGTYVARFNQPGFGPKKGQTVTHINAYTSDSDFFGNNKFLSTFWVSSNYRGLLNAEVNLWGGAIQQDPGTFLVRDSINTLSLRDLLASNPDNYDLVRVPPTYRAYYKYIGSVPEPAPFALLALGLFVMGRWRARNR